MTHVARTRKRDPQRKQKILGAAAKLVAQRGYAGVTMADIGAEVGIAASAIYWHFPGKQQLLVALFDDCLDRLLREQKQAIDRLGLTREALAAVVRLQVEFVVDQRSFAKVYYRESAHLPPTELTRLRAKQRTYVREWTTLLCNVRGLRAHEAEDLVHAAIGAIQSSLVHRSHLGHDELHTLLVDVALRVQSL